MPTPAKLVCAVLFAALAWWTAETIVRVALPEGSLVGRFRELLALAGLVIGWKVIGKTATGPMNRGTRIPVAITAGVGGALILLISGVLLHSFYAMIMQSLTSKYTEVGLAAEAWLEYLWEDSTMVADPVVLGTLFGGG
ncbi:MAG: TrgA family protein, partial [Jannaschia sp.]